MNFTFPANASHPGFTVDVPIRNWAHESQVQSFSIFLGTLYLHYTNVSAPQPFCVPVLGWTRQLFPACCGLDIVFNLHQSSYWSEEILEKWWAWMGGIAPRLRPAIGIIPRYIDQSLNTIEDTTYKWYASKGTQWGDPIKNINYPNHILVPYLFFPAKGIDQILKPTFGMLNQAL